MNDKFCDRLQSLRAKYCDRFLDSQISNLVNGAELVQLKDSEIDFSCLPEMKLLVEKDSARFKQINFLNKLIRNINEYFLINRGKIKEREVILEINSDIQNCIPKTSLYSQIEADIARNGLINPILYWKNSFERKIIVDGHDCYMAALTLGIEYTAKQINIYDKNNAIALRTQLNLNRRQISTPVKAYYIGSQYARQKILNSPIRYNTQERVATEYNISKVIVHYYYCFYRLLQKIEFTFPRLFVAFRDSVFKEKIRFNLKTSGKLLKLKDEDLHRAISYALAMGVLPKLPVFDYDEPVAIPDGKEGIYAGISASGHVLVKVEEKTMAIASNKVRKVVPRPKLDRVPIALKTRPNTINPQDLFPFEQLYGQLEKGIANGWLSSQEIRKLKQLAASC